MSDALIQALSHPACYEPSVQEVECLETPMAWVLLTGDYAYKVSKPLTLGNVIDRSTLEQRRSLCEREVRLSRRVAPHHRLSVVPISGTPESPRLGDDSAPIEYAVKMYQLSPRRLFSAWQAGGQFSRELVDELIVQLVDFHECAETALPGSMETRVESVRDNIELEFERILPQLQDASELHRLALLRTWAAEAFARLRAVLSIRYEQGSVRKIPQDFRCRHVDHDGVAWSFDRVAALDREPWIDVGGDLAGLLVELEARGERPLARHALNRYLELSGDYDLARVLDYFKVYRALERARGILQEAGTQGIGPLQYERCRDYLALAESDSEFRFPYLLIGAGVSGSGKSRFTGETIRRLGGIRLRSDVERMRLFGCESDEAKETIDANLYGPRNTQRTYRRLAELTGILLESGLPVCIDATCLKRQQRDLLAWQAEGRGLPVIIVSFEADEATLRSRIQKRSRGIDDSSMSGLAILEHQLAEREPFGDDERRRLIHLDTTADNATDNLVSLIQTHMRLD
ncbi:AAA family ATPase [Aidingimonas lacisalsi]|uniref:AAA family ATPase n=1 Tax=Aidingimonas lacisalsi TaxID=2604086 RepID=UPI0011D2482D|nr:bifunctional aminoglycoside phosphotransferase/ATP-binding protein [Aidingimonas lacisalsi]